MPISPEGVLAAGAVGAGAAAVCCETSVCCGAAALCAGIL